MWWDCDWWRCLIPRTLQKQPHHQDHRSPLIPQTAENDAVCSGCLSFSAVATMLMSWLNRRRRRYLILILCSPFLLPLFFATCPFICAVEIFCLMCRRRRKAGAGGGGERSRSGNGGGDEVGLLQRYLEDQLLLVVESVYGCGDDDENLGGVDGVDVEYSDSTSLSCNS